MTEPGRPGACPRCGTAYAPGQEYCLECGLRLPSQSGLFGGLAAAWARRGGYPGDWIWPVLVFLLLAALGALAAILISNGSGSNGPTLVGTQPIVTTGGGATTSSVPSVTTPTTTAPPTTTSLPPPPPPPRNRPIAWPGQNGYTVVLESIPTSSGRRVAVLVARRALRGGLAQVGILDSSQYSSLHPGYYVVFSGVYSSYADASAHVSAAKSGGFGSAYPKAVTK